MWINLLLRLIQICPQIEPVVHFYNYPIWPPNAASDFLQTERKAENMPQQSRHFKFFISLLCTQIWTELHDGLSWLSGDPDIGPEILIFPLNFLSYLDIYALDIWCYILYPH